VDEKQKTGNKLLAWIVLSRLPFHTVGVFPFFLGMMIARSQGYPLNWEVAVLSAVAVVLIMLSTYYAGEYYDYETDCLNASYNKFSGGSRILPAGHVPKGQVKIASLICLGGAGVIGLFLFFYLQTGIYTLPLGMLAMLCGFFYSSKPIRWAYRGVGEILIGFCYGWLTVNTGYYLQAGRFDVIPTLVSIPIGISIFLVIFINEFPDYFSDRDSGKKNLVVRLGREKSSWLYAALSGACLVTLLLGLLHGVPRIIGFFAVVPLLFIIRNLLAIKKGEFFEGQPLENLCARTILLNLGITLLYLVGFFWEI
jgi:1,4-dihydroxy-2-naphthoate polyprenyltransferase